MKAPAPPPSPAYATGGSFTSVADCAWLTAGRKRSDKMSADSDPVVIVSAARTAIGERPDPSASDPFARAAAPRTGLA